MSTETLIPVFTLYGETGRFPDVVHSESFSARAPIHDWKIAPHRHAQMAQMIVIFDGQVDAQVDAATKTLVSNEFVFIPALSVHGFVFKPETEGLVLSFPSDVVSSLGPSTPELKAALSRPFFGQIADEMAPVIALMDKVSRDTGPFRTQRSIGLAHAVLATAAESAARKGDDAKSVALSRLEQFDAEISAHMSDGWSASDYASALAVTTGHLSRMCRTAKGIGATAYIEQKVMEEACRLLAFTQLPISAVGYRLGYSDPSYFTKRFQKATDSTPTDYRAQFIS